MTTQEILDSNNTKTRKIELLLQAGMSRVEIANLGVLGKYGAIQNVYAKMQAGSLPTRRRGIDFFSFDRRFGVEIEAYNIPNRVLFDALIAEGVQVAVLGRDTRANSWKITTDSSISGNGVTNAFELVSPILVGEAGLAELEKVCRVLGRLNAKINKSCGLHIHFEAISFSLETWKNLMLNYAKLEDTIDSFMPNSRRADSNTYCKSLKRKVNFETLVQSATNLAQLHGRLESRYFKLNTKSFAEHKTVEFRQHSGTVEFDKIRNWILFLNGLCKKSELGMVQNIAIEGLEFITNESKAFYHNRISELS